MSVHHLRSRENDEADRRKKDSKGETIRRPGLSGLESLREKKGLYKAARENWI